jgi:putative mRNA 3-end processing factor
VLTVDENGLYCAAGDFYIDPWKGVPKDAVITHGHSDHATPGSARYHCSSRSVPILEHRLRSPNLVPHAYRETFHFNDVKVSLHPAGHIRGSAQVRVEHEGEIWVVSGDYKRASDPTCEGFEVVECDTFITEATFALPIYRWEPGESVAREIVEWWRQNEARGNTSILCCYSLGKAQRLLAELVKFTDREVFAHGALLPLTEIYRDDGVDMLPLVGATDHDHPNDFAGELVLAPPSSLATSWVKRFKDHRAAFASGWMRVRGIRRMRGYDYGFVMSDHVDWPGLLRTIEETGCSRVLATHGKTDVLVRHLRELGYDADALETAFEGETED